MATSFRKVLRSVPEPTVAGGLIMVVATFAASDLIKDHFPIPHVDNVFVSQVSSSTTPVSATNFTQVLIPAQPWPDLGYMRTVALQPVFSAIVAPMRPQPTVVNAATASVNKRGAVVASRWASLARRLVRRS